jgi:uncharacterized phage-associated protein
MNNHAKREPISVFDVAEYILKKQGPMTTMKLQKLVYYCQAWSLIWDEKPLYAEKIFAWANGPVVHELFKHFQGQFEVAETKRGNPSRLTAEQRATVDAVLKFYGKKTSQWLSDLTHMERPWKEARKGLGDDERGFQEITPESLDDYYGSLAPMK